MCFFTCSPRPPTLSQRHMDLHVLAYPRHGYIFRVSSKSVQGFRSPRGSKYGLSHYFDYWLLQQRVLLTSRWSRDTLHNYITTYRYIIWLRHIVTSSSVTWSCQQQRSASPRFAVLHSTWRIGGAPVGGHLVGFGSVNCKPVRPNRYFPSFCLKVDFVYLFTIRLKLGIVPTREITTKIEKTFLFLVGGRGPISWMGLMLQHQQHPP